MFWIILNTFTKTFYVLVFTTYFSTISLAPVLMSQESMLSCFFTFNNKDMLTSILLNRKVCKAESTMNLAMDVLSSKQAISQDCNVCVPHKELYYARSVILCFIVLWTVRHFIIMMDFISRRILKLHFSMSCLCIVDFSTVIYQQFKKILVLYYSFIFASSF